MILASLLLSPLVPISAASAGPPGSVAGRYWMTLSVQTRARVPVLGWIPSRTVSMVLVDLATTPGGRWTQRHEVCAVQVESGGQAHTVIPPAFVRALPIKRYDVELSHDDVRWRYAADLGTDHVGYDPALATTVPRRAKDLGVTDPDHDGQPGMTVLIDVPLFGRGEMYIVQRGTMRLDGALAQGDTIVGDVTISSLEQRTLKATNPMFKLSPEIEPVPGGSWFRLERATGATCAGAAQQLDAAQAVL